MKDYFEFILFSGNKSLSIKLKHELKLVYGGVFRKQIFTSSGMQRTVSEPEFPKIWLSFAFIFIQKCYFIITISLSVCPVILAAANITCPDQRSGCSKQTTINVKCDA